jgi:hypothetical protein
MRPHNEYFMNGGAISNMATGSNSTTAVDIVTEAGTFTEIIYNVDADPGAAAPLVVLINGSALGTATIPDTGAADVGGSVPPINGLTEVGMEVEIGDIITLLSTNGPTNTVKGEFTFVIRR